MLEIDLGSLAAVIGRAEVKDVITQDGEKAVLHGKVNRTIPNFLSVLREGRTADVSFTVHESSGSKMGEGTVRKAPLSRMLSNW